ncbi:MAG: ROK family transcriptional regulator [Planctomycetota bacterium]
MSSVNLRKKEEIPKIAQNGTETAILRAIRDGAPISRSGIAQQTGMQLAAVSRSVTRLIRAGVLLETPLADANGPRRKRGLSLNPAAGHCLSVAYDASGIEGVVVDAAYGVRHKESVAAPIGAAPRQEKVDRIATFVEGLRARVPSSIGDCLALAAVDPGVVDETTGRVLFSSTMDDWRDVPIVEILRDRLGLPILLLQTSTATIRAVDHFELRGAARNALYIEYSEGVGCGMKLGGQVVAGRLNLAGELGHTRVTDDPAPCRCGAVGCLEAVAALPALARKVRAAIEEGSHTSLTERETVSGADVLAAAAAGDRLASRIVEEAFGYVGRAVGGLVNVLAPEIVVIDSAVAAAGEAAVGALLRAIRSNTLPTHGERLEVRISALASHTKSLGGAAAVLDRCLQA